MEYRFLKDYNLGVQDPKNKRYVNYHHHTYYSNPATVADSALSPKEFVRKSLELGNPVVTTCEHGSSLSFFEYYGLLKYCLKDDDGIIVEDFRDKFKMIFATEAYFVIDNQTKDSTNAHIVLIAKNDKGRREINYVCSLAAEFGFYRRPRLSLKDILGLNPENVMVTTACLGGVWKYNNYNPYKEELDELISFENKFQQIENSPNKEASIALLFKDSKEYEEQLQNYLSKKDNMEEMCKEYSYMDLINMFHQHFKDSFYLEVQPHNTDIQKEINSKIKEISANTDIPIIIGCDSHANDEDSDKRRDVFLLSKGVVYDDEHGWLHTYDSHEEVVQHFLKQGIFNREEIEQYLDNTLIIETFEQPYVDTKIKLPTIYPGKSQEEKDKIFTDLIWNLWKGKKEELIKENLEFYNQREVIPFSKYEDEIAMELDVVIKTHMADYFLFNYYMIKIGVEKYGGVITKTSRGSGGSFYLNNILGLTSIDRIAEKVPMLSERFMSISRILETVSLPDIDQLLVA